MSGRRTGGGEHPLDRFLAGLVEEGLYTAAAALVGSAAAPEWTGAAGLARTDPPVSATPEGVFDLASLSKPLSATLALELDARGLLPLDLRVGEVWPRARGALAGRSLEDLLRHRAGLAAWTPLYIRCRERSQVPDLLLGDALPESPPGTYSDLGYVLWGLAAEERLGEPLASLLARCVLGPLGLHGVTVAPDGGLTAACTADTARGGALAAEQGLEIEVLPAPAPGRPQDGNARFLGGFPGHAGLFGGLRDLHRLAAEWLRPGALLAPELVRRALEGGGPFALGWARRRGAEGVGGPLSATAFGHTGFTGGSLWIDPAAGGGRIALLLGHRASALSDLTAARRRFNALAAGG